MTKEKTSANPLITIIVAMYGGEKYISEAIESIINQDYLNLEIIMVDDGSPDRCGEIADQYALKDHRIRVIHKKNSGVSSARNEALDISRGEYVCIVDQDDVLAHNYISYFYKLIIDNDAEVSATPSVNKFFGKLPKEQLVHFNKVKVIPGEDAATEMLYHKLVIAPWNKMIKRSLIESNDIRFNTKYFNGEGFAFSIECFQAASRVAVGEDKVYYYRVGDPESGASKFKLETIHSSIEAQQYILSKLNKSNQALIAAWNFSNWHTKCDALNIMVGCGATKKYNNLYKKISDDCRNNAYLAFSAPISKQQKLRGVMFSINPYMAAKIINCFRTRKFAKISEGGG